MKEKRNILVFPCGSEIGLEVYRSLKYSTYFNLIGGSSIDDHGRFVFENYISDIPYVTDSCFIPKMKRIVEEYNISAIYPATDMVITYLKRAEHELGCKIISPCLETTEICLSKKKTYVHLANVIPVPREYQTLESIDHFPVFGKLDIGHSAIGTQRLDDESMVKDYMLHHPDAVICDYLPGDEYTVDCFSKSDGTLLFYGVRVRARIKNGISVRTIPFEDNNDEFGILIRKINEAIPFRGAWFAQFKRDVNGNLCLLEIAARLGGSSALYRAQGVNFAQMTLFDAFGYDVSLVRNKFYIEMDRALDNVYKINIQYSEVYVDFDDCLLIDKKYVNTDLVAFFYQCLNEHIKLTLLTHHDKDIHESLKAIRLDEFFDRIVHIDRSKPKSDYIDNENSIFIDDSFAERLAVAKSKHIPVFSVDMVNMLRK